MVLLEANPLEHIHFTQQIKGVVVKEDCFTKKALDRLLRQLQPISQTLSKRKLKCSYKERVGRSLPSFGFRLGTFHKGVELKQTGGSVGDRS